MAAPRVVRAPVCVWLESAAEFRLGEGRYIVGGGDRRVRKRRIKDGYRVAKLLQKQCLRVDLAGMGIEPAQRSKENLTLRSKSGACANDLRDLGQLLP